MSESNQPLESDAAIDSFERAFSHTSTREFTCDCGKVYWDAHNSGYDWQEGEVEKLQADPNVHACGHAIGIIDIDGRQYADACNCWHPLASRIIRWLEANRDEVVAFLRMEKQRCVAEANQMATVEDESQRSHP